MSIPNALSLFSFALRLRSFAHPAHHFGNAFREISVRGRRQPTERL